MKIIHCPINGPRPLQEFVYGGEVRTMPDPSSVSDEQWADYVFNRNGEPGVKREWWYHLASGAWFIAERDIVTDTFIRTYLYNQSPPAPPGGLPPDAPLHDGATSGGGGTSGGGQ